MFDNKGTAFNSAVNVHTCRKRNMQAVFLVFHPSYLATQDVTTIKCNSMHIEQSK